MKRLVLFVPLLCLLCVAREGDFSDCITVGYPIAERYTDLEVSGSSTVMISCCESITGKLSGASDLYYKALPGCSLRVNCSTGGGSEVHRQ